MYFPLFLRDASNLAALVAALAALVPAASLAQGGDPILTVGPASTPSPAFLGDTLRFTVTATDPDGEPLTYSWNFGDGTSTPYGPSPQASHAYAAPGRYAVLVRVRDASGLATASFIQVVHLRRPVGKSTAASTVIYDAGRKRLFAVNPDNHSLAAVDPAGMRLLGEYPVGKNPRTVAQHAGGPLWVANQGDASLTVLHPDNGSVLRQIALPLGSQPHGIAFAPDGSAVYVTLQATGRLAKADPATFQVTSTVPVGPHPRGLAVAADGRIFVARFLSPEDKGEVREVDPAAFTVKKTFDLAYDPHADTESSGGGLPNYLAALGISPHGKSLFIPSKKDNAKRGLVRNGMSLTFEHTVRTVLSHIDLDGDRELLDMRLDFDDADQASAVAFSPLGDLVFVALQGINRVDVLDPYNNGGGSLLRLLDVGLAPQGLAVDPEGKRLFVHNFMSRDVAAYDLTTVLANTLYDAPLLGRAATVSIERLPADVLKGKQIFYNAGDRRMNKDGYVSCASCHLDGGGDRRVWDFTDRGEGLRRTTVLTGRGGMDHGPVHWTANFDEIQDFEHDMRGPMQGGGFLDAADFLAGTRNQSLGDPKARLSADLDALAAYVTSLKEFPISPFRNPDGSLTAEARAGQAIFTSAETGCARCHGGPRFTDSRLPKAGEAPPPLGAGDVLTPQGFLLHDVGTLKPTSGKRLNDSLKGLDTPTLLGVWDGGPYLHDGSAPSLLDVITTANPADKHGKTSHLTANQKGQLVAYLEQLDGYGESVSLRRESTAPGPKLSAHALPDGRIRFAWSLPGPASNSNVTLRIHDLRGRLVRALAAPGRAGSLFWDLRDARDRRLSRGRYQVRLESGRETAMAAFTAAP